MTALWLLIGIALGAGIAWVAFRARISVLADQAADARAAREAEGAALRDVERLQTTIEHERRAAEEKIALVEQAQEKLADSFKALSAEALKSNNQSFLELAKEHLGQHQVEARKELEERQKAVEQLVKPLGETLGVLEKERRQAYGELTNHLRTVTETQDQLRRETANLVTALRAPQTRGRWGEIQLRRVCEMAGMINHCDFLEQKTVDGDDGRLRPDVVVQLPGGKQVVVDAKVPLIAYLDAIEAQDEATRALHIQAHVRQMRDHIKKLASKSYWSQFEDSPEFVVMFVDESMYRVALDEAPSLIEEAFEQHVLIATPATLLGLLRAVHYGWRQEKLAESAREVAALGHELHSRLRTFAEHLARVGRSLGSSVKAYNEAVGSLETRVMVSARKLEDAGVASETQELTAPTPVELAPRPVAQFEDSPEESEAEMVLRRLDAA